MSNERGMNMLHSLEEGYFNNKASIFMFIIILYKVSKLKKLTAYIYLLAYHFMAAHTHTGKF